MKIGEYRLGDILWYHPILAGGGGVFGHVLRLDQSRASKSLGWIMSKDMNLSVNALRYSGSMQLKLHCALKVTY